MAIPHADTLCIHYSYHQLFANWNERDFSLAGIYTALRRANVSVEMLSEFLFINRNSSDLGRNTTIDVFGGSLDDVSNIVGEMESNPYASADASETE